MDLVVRELAGQPSIFQLFGKRHVRDGVRIAAVPNVGAREERVRDADRPGDLERPPRAPAVEPALKLYEPSLDAAVFVRAKGVGCKVGADLGPDRFAKVAHFAAP